jgi:hypothetical protein
MPPREQDHTQPVPAHAAGTHRSSAATIWATSELCGQRRRQSHSQSCGCSKPCDQPQQVAVGRAVVEPPAHRRERAVPVDIDEDGVVGDLVAARTGPATQFVHGASQPRAPGRRWRAIKRRSERHRGGTWSTSSTSNCSRPP